MTFPCKVRPVLLALITGLLATGCRGKTASTTSQEAKPDLGAQYNRGTERQHDQSELEQLGIFCAQYRAENGRNPNLEELKAYVQKDYPQLYQALQAGRYVLVPNAGAASNNVLAYEKEADFNGNRLVTMGDGSVHLMSVQDFQAALQNKGG